MGAVRAPFNQDCLIGLEPVTSGGRREAQASARGRPGLSEEASSRATRPPPHQTDPAQRIRAADNAPVTSGWTQAAGAGALGKFARLIPAPSAWTLSPSESTGLLTSARTLCLPTEHYEVALSFFHMLLKPPSRPVDERLHLCRRDVEEIPPG